MIKLIVDTREHAPHWWTFDNMPHERVHTKLDTGDYSIAGYEDILTIERKKSVSELAGNITEDRFWREIVRMQDIRHSFLFLEFGYEDINDYPANLKVNARVKKGIRVKGPFILHELSRIQVEFGIPVVYCGHKCYAEQAAISVFKRTLELYRNKEE